MLQLAILITIAVLSLRTASAGILHSSVGMAILVPSVRFVQINLSVCRANAHFVMEKTTVAQASF